MPCVDAWADSEDESADAREAGDDAQTCEHITDAEVERRKVRESPRALACDSLAHFHRADGARAKSVD